jgi:hypothetical protein
MVIESTGNKTRPASEAEFDALARAISGEAMVLDSLHDYFVQHRHHIYLSCSLFNLLAGEWGDVLKIGPFYTHTPFLLRPRTRSYVVLEGADPSAYPLAPLCQIQAASRLVARLLPRSGTNVCLAAEKPAC